jgi:predicted ATPase/SAM-dependent methyltransferase
VIRELILPEILTGPIGIKPAHLRDLGKVVVLAGPNGAGKSRYLSMVGAVASSQHPTAAATMAVDSRRDAETFRRAAQSLSGVAREVQERQAAVFEEQAARNQAIVDAVDDEARSTLAAPGEHIARITRNHEDAVRPREALRESEADTLASAGLQSVGLKSAYVGMDAYCTLVARALFNADHPVLQERPSAKESARSAEAFVTILQGLLHQALGYDVDSNDRVVPTLGGRPLLARELSEGERLLIAWSIMLHQQVSSLSDCIILLDEPENHLHPDVCITAVRRLEAVVARGHGQIWIATHSLPVIAAFSLSSTYLVDCGEIVYGGNRAGELVTRLLGGEENHRALQRLLFDADGLAFQEFAAQCLLGPQVAPHKDGDKQEALFRRRVTAGLAPDRVLRVLDFGAGSGRMAAALAELLRARPVVARQLEYVAYNPGDQDAAVHEACQRHVSVLGGLPGVTAMYVKDARAVQPPSSTLFDIVLLCNVMHEVHPTKWRTLFQDVHACMADDGSALVMEDQQMAVGEMPHVDGFLVVDIFQMRTLFAASAAEVPEVPSLPTCVRQLPVRSLV